MSLNQALNEYIQDCEYKQDCLIVLNTKNVRVLVPDKLYWACWQPMFGAWNSW